jgi:hypothetical protein
LIGFADRVNLRKGHYEQMFSALPPNHNCSRMLPSVRGGPCGFLRLIR